jgi:hypothetical protein
MDNLLVQLLSGFLPMGQAGVIVVEVQLQMFWTRSWTKRMHVVVHTAVRSECVNTGPHVRAVIVKADAKGCEGEVAIEEPNALPKMAGVCI